VKDEQWLHGHSFAIGDHKGAETKGAGASQQKKVVHPSRLHHNIISSDAKNTKIRSRIPKKIENRRQKKNSPEREEERERRQRDKNLNTRRRVCQPVLVEIQSGPLEKIKTRSCCDNRGLFRTSGESWP